MRLNEPDEISREMQRVIEYAQAGDYAKAIGLLKPLESHIEGNAAYAILAAKLYLTKSDTRRAKAYLQQALVILPSSAEAAYLISQTVSAQASAAQAVRWCLRANWIAPNTSVFLASLGNALRADGQVSAAVLAYQAALDLGFIYIEVLTNLGYCLIESERYLEAVNAFDSTIQLKADFFPALRGLGLALGNCGQWERALPILITTSQADPSDIDVQKQLTIAHQRRGAFEIALTNAANVVTLSPQDYAATAHLGDLLQSLNSNMPAVQLYLRSLKIFSYRQQTHSNLAAAYHAMGNDDCAFSHFAMALAIAPDFADAHYSLGSGLRISGLMRQGIRPLTRARLIDPNNTNAIFNESLSRLSCEDFTVGWQMYEARWSSGNLVARHTERQRWLGQAIKSKRILLHAEQGLGDTLQFMRYVPMVQALGAQITLEVQRPLVRLAELALPDINVISMDTACPPTDFECPLMSLPLAFGTDASSIPPPLNTLKRIVPEQPGFEPGANPKNGLRIGLAWSGNITHKTDHNRSIALQQLAPILDLPGMEFHVVQKGIRQGDMDCLTRFKNLKHHDEQIQDFLDLAGLIAKLDLVISVDTAVAHLAGSLGKPCWLMLPWAPDWRWQLDRKDTPWYPSVTLFRQDRTRNWQSVINTLVGSLPIF